VLGGYGAEGENRTGLMSQCWEGMDLRVRTALV